MNKERYRQMSFGEIPEAVEWQKIIIPHQKSALLQNNVHLYPFLLPSRRREEKAENINHILELILFKLMHTVDNITQAKDSTLEKKQIIEKGIQGRHHYYTLYRLRWGDKIRLTEEEQELIAKFSERISLPFLQYNPFTNLPYGLPEKIVAGDYDYIDIYTSESVAIIQSSELLKAFRREDLEANVGLVEEVIQRAIKHPYHRVDILKARRDYWRHPKKSAK